MINLDSILKSRVITLPTKVHLVKAMVFPMVMYGWELDYKETWVLKNWSFWTVVLEKTLESPLDCKEIQPVHPKGDQSWVFIGRTDVEADTPILWPPDAKSWLIGKDLDAGRDWGQEEKGMAEDETAGWVWVDCAPWVWTRRPGLLRFIGSQRVRHDWATELSDWCMLMFQCLDLTLSTSLVPQRLKHLSAMQETWVWSLGQEDPLEKEMTTHSSIIAWRIPWMEEPCGPQSTGSQRIRHIWAT